MQCRPAKPRQPRNRRRARRLPDDLYIDPERAVAATGANVQATYLSHPQGDHRFGTIYVPGDAVQAARAALEAAGFAMAE